MSDLDVLAWYANHVRPLLEKHAQEKIPALENDRERLTRLHRRSDVVTVCFVGNAGIGKSTLLNALAVGDLHVLPAGGIGPLTAQATEMHYSEVPQFRVAYHARSQLWKLVFALEQQLRAGTKADDAARQSSSAADDFGLTEDEMREARDEIGEPSPEADSEHPETRRRDEFIKQARQIVAGDQFGERELSYLVDALRIVAGHKPKWGTTVTTTDLPRIERVRRALEFAANGKPYERSQSEDPGGFLEDLRIHAAGFLAPLIREIKVGWPSDLLRAGITLVDLPGIGIAQDAYREITQRYVREQARAVVLVVDRAGPTDATMNLLRASGYWNRVVGAADDPSSDPCSILIAVTRVDDVADTEWLKQKQLANGNPVPKKREVFARLVEEMKPRMKTQIAEQLDKIGATDNDAVNEARRAAKEAVLASLEVHPVSAPQYVKALRDDEEDRPFLADPRATGIPSLEDSMLKLAQAERAARQAAIQEVTFRLARAALAELKIIEGQWRESDRAAAEADRLRDALEKILAQKRKDHDLRVGGFREFLESTMEVRIRELVLEARAVAEKEVNTYLLGLRELHWQTLKAAVTRGGVWLGGTRGPLNLPDDIATYFQEPMAALWGQKLLRTIRARTGQLSEDISAMVGELCDWASEHGGAHIDERVLDQQRTRIADQTVQLRQVGKEAVDELRALVKQRLTQVIKRPIQARCKAFVEKGEQYGKGVKNRILELFGELAVGATTAAEKPAIEVLRENFSEVREEIRAAFEQWGNPLEETADLIVARHKDRAKRSDAQKRNRVLADVQVVLANAPACALDPTPAT